MRTTHKREGPGNTCVWPASVQEKVSLRNRSWDLGVVGGGGSGIAMLVHVMRAGHGVESEANVVVFACAGSPSKL